MADIKESTIDREIAKKGSFHEERYKTLFESMDEAFCIIKVEFDENNHPVDYRHLEVNPAFERLTGMKNIEGESVREGLPGHEEYWFEIYGKVALTGEAVRFEQRAGELNKWYSLYAFRVGEPEERKVAVLFSDITKQKEVQEEHKQLLRRIESDREQLEGMFRNAPSFMCVLRGPDHIFVRSNTLYYKIIGNRDILGKPLREALPEIVEQRFIDLLDEVYQTGEAYKGVDERVLLETQTDDTESQFKEYFLDFVYQPIKDSNGAVTGIFVQGVDLTERKQAKEEMKALNATLEERVEKRTAELKAYQNQLRLLASELSKAEENERKNLAGELHDNLGQMLAVTKMELDLLQRGGVPGPLADRISKITDLVVEAITYTRKLMTDLTPPPSLNEANMETALNWLAQKMQKHDLNVIIENDEQPMTMREEIQKVVLQCVRELLFNVVKHSGVNDCRLHLSCSDGYFQITVEDEGRGFDVDHSQSKYENEGFGLFNIQERIDLLGGRVAIASKQGKGTKVTIFAPVKENNQLAKSSENEYAEPRTSSRQGKQKIKVMLADDHDMMREGLRSIIDEQDDLTVIAEASDGKEAIKLAGETAPDVILMDVNMPGMNGIQATQMILAESPHIPIIGLSLHNHKHVIEEMRNAGASAYLTKSEAFETLCATIRSEAAAAEG